MTTEVRTKKVTPPYATPAGLEIFFDKIKTIKPTTLTTKWAEDHELPFADAVVNTMKFLGAVNRDGSLTPAFSKLRLEGDPFQATLRQLVTVAYGPIFDQIDDISAVPETTLNNAFKSTYDVGSPGRYVRPFLKLCELAGLREAATADEVRTRPPRTPSRQSHKPNPKVVAPQSSRAVGNDSFAQFQIVLRLDIPWDAPIEEIRSRVAALRALESGRDS
jgi:hypothetical protein